MLMQSLSVFCMTFSQGKYTSFSSEPINDEHRPLKSCLTDQIIPPATQSEAPVDF